MSKVTVTQESVNDLTSLVIDIEFSKQGLFDHIWFRHVQQSLDADVEVNKAGGLTVVTVVEGDEPMYVFVGKTEDWIE